MQSSLRRHRWSHLPAGGRRGRSHCSRLNANSPGLNATRPDHSASDGRRKVPTRDNSKSVFPPWHHSGGRHGSDVRIVVQHTHSTSAIDEMRPDSDARHRAGQICESVGHFTASSERVVAPFDARRCACEVRNPRGVCCLGDVAAAVKRIASESARAQVSGQDGSEAWKPTRHIKSANLQPEAG